jgi:tetratricopeptide (TPR) repeat protein
MSLLKTAVFLASRFEEFANLRKQLKELIVNYPVVQFAPIDLNDGNVSHRPPLAECLGYVRRADFMILLLGDSYGSMASKAGKSFTHLEYEEAIQDGAGTRVLVFGIGENYRGGRIRYSEDESLAGWQKQVEENHTMGFFDPETSPEAIAKSIFDRLLAALYEMRFGALSVDDRGDVPDDLFDAIEDDSLLDDTVVSALEERNARGPSLADDRARFATTLAALTQPAAVAAQEQREEAQRALDIGEYGVAIHHLKRALELKPLELISNYWLAQLFVALGRKEKALEAMDLAERAGRIAESEALPYRASAAYVTAARAARLAGYPDEANGFAKQAVEVAPRFARAHLERARQFALDQEPKAALDAIRHAFALYSRSLREVLGDPVFRPMRKEVDTLVHELKAKIAHDVAELSRIEGEIAKLAGKSVLHLNLVGKTISQLIEIGRQSSRRQYEHLCVLLDDAEQKVQEIHAQPTVLPPTTKEMLRFSRPGRARIVEWFKHPSEIIQPEDAVFSFHYEGSTKVMPWLLRGRTSVRMTTRAGNNETWVSSESPYLFEHISDGVQVTGPNRFQQLRKAIETTGLDKEANNVRLKEITTAQEETICARNLHQRQGVAVPGVGLLLASAGGVVAGCVFFYSVAWPVGFLMIGASLYFAKIGSSHRNAYLSRRDELQRSLKQIEQQQVVHLDSANQNEAKLTVFRNELSTIETACEDAKNRARKALELFEGVTLRKGGRLLPFPSIFGAHTGDVVRVFKRQLDQMKTESARAIEIQNDHYEWLIGDGNIKTNFHLLRVIEESQERLVFSYRQAYFVVKVNQ